MQNKVELIHPCVQFMFIIEKQFQIHSTQTKKCGPFLPNKVSVFWTYEHKNRCREMESDSSCPRHSNVFEHKNCLRYFLILSYSLHVDLVTFLLIISFYFYFYFLNNNQSNRNKMFDRNSNMSRHFNVELRQVCGLFPLSIVAYKKAFTIKRVQMIDSYFNQNLVVLIILFLPLLGI